ncbi:restriction endonuclease subunit S [Limnothrix sp. FACHB-1083]|uniref:restriction endonuclease subunit S n=1 Tax=Limnothrix sp. FACHB-1083 TaxID=2692815 RepID=UPI0016812509|nr:restriction endonuclease subunit S [Limnothrix sp. FACHB-1083]MBD2190162.1 restriction endonuclease subunit S [Limnothrix sp. FACHB-1088]
MYYFLIVWGKNYIFLPLFYNLNLSFNTSAKKCDYFPIHTPVLRIPNIGDGHVIKDDLKYAAFNSREIENLQLCSGDILVIRSNGSLDLVGKAAIASDKEEGFLYAGYLIRIRPDLKAILPKYLYFHLTEPQTRAEIEALAKSTSGVNNINSQELKSLRLFLPDLTEQKEIVRRVEERFKAIEAIEQHYQKAIQLLDRLDQATLAKAFRGQLVPQDPNDEPASVLLERIRAQRASQPPARKRKPKATK